MRGHLPDIVNYNRPKSRPRRGRTGRHAAAARKKAAVKPCSRHSPRQSAGAGGAACSIRSARAACGAKKLRRLCRRSFFVRIGVNQGGPMADGHALAGRAACGEFPAPRVLCVFSASRLWRPSPPPRRPAPAAPRGAPAARAAGPSCAASWAARPAASCGWSC